MDQGVAHCQFLDYVLGLVNPLCQRGSPVPAVTAESGFKNRLPFYSCIPKSRFRGAFSKVTWALHVSHARPVYCVPHSSLAQSDRSVSPRATVLSRQR